MGLETVQGDGLVSATHLQLEELVLASQHLVRISIQRQQWRYGATTLHLEMGGHLEGCCRYGRNLCVGERTGRQHVLTAQ